LKALRRPARDDRDAAGHLGAAFIGAIVAHRLEVGSQMSRCKKCKRALIAKARLSFEPGF
jgi:hypothetical protein